MTAEETLRTRIARLHSALRNFMDPNYEGDAPQVAAEVMSEADDDVRWLSGREGALQARIAQLEEALADALTLGDLSQPDYSRVKEQVRAALDPSTTSQWLSDHDAELERRVNERWKACLRTTAEGDIAEPAILEFRDRVREDERRKCEAENAEFEADMERDLRELTPEEEAQCKSEVDRAMALFKKKMAENAAHDARIAAQARKEALEELRFVRRRLLGCASDTTHAAECDARDNHGPCDCGSRLLAATPPAPEEPPRDYFKSVPPGEPLPGPTLTREDIEAALEKGRRDAEELRKRLASMPAPNMSFRMGASEPLPVEPPPKCQMCGTALEWGPSTTAYAYSCLKCRLVPPRDPATEALITELESEPPPKCKTCDDEHEVFVTVGLGEPMKKVPCPDCAEPNCKTCGRTKQVAFADVMGPCPDCSDGHPLADAFEANEGPMGVQPEPDSKRGGP